MFAVVKASFLLLVGFVCLFVCLFVVVVVVVLGGGRGEPKEAFICT